MCDHLQGHVRLSVQQLDLCTLKVDSAVVVGAIITR